MRRLPRSRGGDDVLMACYVAPESWARALESRFAANPDGFAWEVAWNLGFSLMEDGRLQLPD